jgi:capsular polysaccharide transport system permease protein
MTANEALRQQRAEQRVERRRAIARSGALFVLAPTLLTAIYLLIIAPPEFTSEASFTVRGAQQQAGNDILGTIGLAAPTEASADARIAADYIRSSAMVQALRRQAGFNEAYSRWSLDPSARISPRAAIESATKFWRKKVKVESNINTGGTTFSVKAYRPQDSLRLARGVLNATEQTVNSLSRRPMGNLQQVNLDEVERTRNELQAVQERLSSFQGANAVVPTQAPVTAALGLVGGLDSQIAQLRAEYASMLQTFQPSSAQAQAVQGKINALEAERQRAVERALSAPGENLATTEVEARAILLDYEFAQRAYHTAVASLEASRRDVRTDTKYVVAYVPPELPQKSNYFSRLWNIVAVFIAAAFLWGIGALTYSVLKEHLR